VDGKSIGIAGPLGDRASAPVSSHRPQLHAGALLDHAEPTNDLSLPVPRNVAVARKRRQDVLVAEILRPGFVLLRRLADLPAEQR
jgi:hypothetical protein